MAGNGSAHLVKVYTDHSALLTILKVEGKQPSDYVRSTLGIVEYFV